MTVGGARGHEQAFAGLQRHGGLTVLLPNARSRDDVKGYCGRMVVARIDRAWRVLRVPNNHFLRGNSVDFAFQQALVGDTLLAPCCIWHVLLGWFCHVLLGSRWFSDSEAERDSCLHCDEKTDRFMIQSFLRS